MNSSEDIPKIQVAKKSGDPGTPECSLPQLGEFGLIREFAKIFHSTMPDIQEQRSRAPAERVASLGIGDDCAVLPGAVFGEQARGAGYFLITTDTLVENRHFRFAYTTPEALGQKILAVSLSDIAAMGGTPVAAVLTVAVPKTFAVDTLVRLSRGIADIAKEFQVQIVGGDTVQSKEVSFGATVFGHSLHLPVQRGGAKVGDDIWVSGYIGDGGAGLKLCEQKISASSIGDGGAEFFKKYHTPHPRVQLGKMLAEKQLASGMLDISDGLLQDAGHIASQSAVHLAIKQEALPLRRAILEAGLSPLFAATCGDDYELLFTANPQVRSALESLSVSDAGGCQLSRIGTVEQGQAGEVSIEIAGVRYSPREALAAAGVSSKGFEHFID